MKDNEMELIKKLEQSYIQRALNHVSFMEGCRYSHPNVELNDIEYQFLVGVAQGRTKREFDLALSIYGLTYSEMVRRIKVKFEAQNITHSVYKAMQMGILK